MNDEMWVLDAIGRTGQATAMRPHHVGVAVVPVGPELAEAVGGEFVKGLESIQTGFDIQKRGVSVKKVVVSL